VPPCAAEDISSVFNPSSLSIIPVFMQTIWMLLLGIILTAILNIPSDANVLLSVMT
jgi:hypothetical protein